MEQPPMAHYNRAIFRHQDRHETSAQERQIIKQVVSQRLAMPPRHGCSALAQMIRHAVATSIFLLHSTADQQRLPGRQSRSKPIYKKRSATRKSIFSCCTQEQTKPRFTALHQNRRTRVTTDPNYCREQPRKSQANDRSCRCIPSEYRPFDPAATYTPKELEPIRCLG